MVFLNECCTPLDAKATANGSDVSQLPPKLQQLLDARHTTIDADGQMPGPRFGSRAAMREKDKGESAVAIYKVETLERRRTKDRIKNLKFLCKSPLTSNEERLNHSLTLHNLVRSLNARDESSLGDGGQRSADGTASVASDKSSVRSIVVSPMNLNSAFFSAQDQTTSFPSSNPASASDIQATLDARTAAIGLLPFEPVREIPAGSKVLDLVQRTAVNAAALEADFNQFNAGKIVGVASLFEEQTKKAESVSDQSNYSSDDLHTLRSRHPVNSSDFSFDDSGTISEDNVGKQKRFDIQFQRQYVVMDPDYLYPHDSLFAAVILFMGRFNATRKMSSKKRPFPHMSIPELRFVVSDYTRKHSGKIPGMEPCEFDEDGNIMLPVANDSGNGLFPVHFSTYCDGIQTTWGGADMELYAISNLFKLKIKIYSMQHEAYTIKGSTETTHILRLCHTPNCASLLHGDWDKYSIFMKRSKNRVRGTPLKLQLCPSLRSRNLTRLDATGLPENWRKMALPDGTPIFVDVEGTTHWTVPCHQKQYSVLNDHEEALVQVRITRHENETRELETVATYLTETICREGDYGNGFFAVVDLPAHKAVSVYDGDRVDRNGVVEMTCPRLNRIRATLPGIQPTIFHKNWCVAVHRQSHSSLVIDGAPAAHPSLNLLFDHGGVGTGSTINSCVGTGKPANCVFKWRKRTLDPLVNASSTFYGAESHVDAVLYTSVPGDSHVHSLPR